MKKHNYKKLKYKDTPCLYCGNKETELVLSSGDFINNLPGEFHLSRCLKCGLMYQNPRIKKKLIDWYYPDSTSYFSEQSKNHSISNLTRQTLINHFGYPGSRSLMAKLKTLPIVRGLKVFGYPAYVDHGRLLEIGCGNGEFLKLLNELGWKTKGLEPQAKSAAYCREELGLDVDQKHIEDTQFPDKSFDAIVMRMVLEHVYEPFAILRKVSKWLKPGGRLIIAIPYLNSLEFRIFKEYSYMLHLPNHLSFPDKQHIRRSLAADFSNVTFYKRSSRNDIIRSASFRAKEHSRLLDKIVLHSFMQKIIPLIAYLRSYIGSGARITIHAIKKGS